MKRSPPNHSSDRPKAPANSRDRDGHKQPVSPGQSERSVDRAEAPSNNSYDLIIVGAGPAGLATALHLLKRDPSWTDRLLVLEASVHPREKLCGGGITRLGEEALTALDLELGVPSLEIRELRSLADHFDTSLRGSPVFRIVERAQFDAWLLSEARRRGATVREGEPLIAARRLPEAIKLRTEASVYRASVVVAADGAASAVRRLLGSPAQGGAADRGAAQGPATLMETTYFPVDAPTVGPPAGSGDNPGVSVGSKVGRVDNPGGGVEARLGPRRAWFDFRRMAGGLQGYVWDFPAIRGRRRGVNVGIFDSRIVPARESVALRRFLEREMAGRRQSASREAPVAGSQGARGHRGIRGFPFRRYEPRRRNFSAPRLLYVGDAAGADPMLGEGISFALGYGEVAAEQILAAFENGEFDFRGYYRAIHRHRVTSQLYWRRRAARLFYRLRRPWAVRALWAVIPLLTRLLILFVPEYIPGNRPRLEVRRPRLFRTRRR